MLPADLAGERVRVLGLLDALGRAESASAAHQEAVLKSLGEVDLITLRLSMTPEEYALQRATQVGVDTARKYAEVLGELGRVMAEREHFKSACIKQNHVIEQTLGRALGFPENQALSGVGGQADDIQVFMECGETLATQAAAELGRMQKALEAVTQAAQEFLDDLEPIEEFPGYAPTTRINWVAERKLAALLAPAPEDRQ